MTCQPVGLPYTNGFVSVAGRLRWLHEHPTRTSTNPIFARVLLTALYGPLLPQMLSI